MIIFSKKLTVTKLFGLGLSFREFIVYLRDLKELKNKFLIFHVGRTVLKCVD